MSRHSKFFFSILLITSLTLFSIHCGAALAVTQEQIDGVRSQRDAIRARRLEKQALVDSLNLQQADVVSRKTAMDERNAFTLQQIELTEEEIRLNDQLLAEKAQEVEQAKAVELQQLQRYRSRVRALEENGRLGFLSLVLRSTSLAELLTLADDMGEIMRSDRELEDNYIRLRLSAEQIQAEYRAVRDELGIRQAQLRSEQQELEGEIAETESFLQTLRSEIASNQAEFEAVIAAEWAADAELERLMAELERERQAERERQEQERIRREEAARREAEEAAGRQAEEAATRAEISQTTGGEAIGTGSFVWPVPGHNYVTSRFGLRVHPITGVQKSHTGIDISADTGTPIVAADSGKVTKAAVYGGYGNCVILDHGNGYVTLYGHLSRIAVSEGESVSQGQTIGSVGSTGLSTGPHCHFEVWSGGVRTDPEALFTGLEFSPGAGE